MAAPMDVSIPSTAAGSAMEQTVQDNMGERGGPEEGNSRRSSDIWNHFCLSSDGTVATCNNCQQTYTTNGTSHLWRHNRSCQGQGVRSQKRSRRSPPARQASSDCAEPSVLLLDANNNINPLGELPSLSRPAQSNNWFNQEECTSDLAGMIAFHGYPSSIIDDECFRSFVRRLNPEFQMPSRVTVEATCRQRTLAATNQLRETLVCCSGNISLAIGKAGTDQGEALYMACQFIDEEWTLQKKIMQVFMVVPFPPYQQGALLGIKEVSIEVEEDILEEIKYPRRAWPSCLVRNAASEWGLKGRLFSVARGQELNDTTSLLAYMGPFWPFSGPPIPMLKANIVTYTSDVMNKAAKGIFSSLCPYFVEACFKAVKGLRLDIEKRARYFSELGLNHVGRYDKRWYSYYCALEVLHKEFTDNNVALEEPPAPYSWFEMEELADNEEVIQRHRRRKQVQELLLSRRFKENQLTELLRSILGVTYRAILRISSSTCPTSNLCIEELMQLREVLQSEAMNARQDVTKAVAYAKVCGFRDGKDVDTILLDARCVLDRFLKDSLEYLPISAMLDPRFKLHYVTDVFNEVFGTEAPGYISRVQKRIKDFFTSYQRKLCNGVNGEGTSSMAAGTSNPPDGSITEMERYLTDVCVTKVFKEVYGTEDPSFIPRVRKTIEDIVKERRREHCIIPDLERYLADDVIPSEEREGFDVLIWWKENGHRYPTVASVARDFLAMPSSDVLSPEHLALVRSMASSHGAVYPGKELDSDDDSEYY